MFSNNNTFQPAPCGFCVDGIIDRHETTYGGIVGHHYTCDVCQGSGLLNYTMADIPGAYADFPPPPPMVTIPAEPVALPRAGKMQEVA